MIYNTCMDAMTLRATETDKNSVHTRYFDEFGEKKR